MINFKPNSIFFYKQNEVDMKDQVISELLKELEAIRESTLEDFRFSESKHERVLSATYVNENGERINITKSKYDYPCASPVTAQL